MKDDKKKFKFKKKGEERDDKDDDDEKEEKSLTRKDKELLKAAKELIDEDESGEEEEPERVSVWKGVMNGLNTLSNGLRALAKAEVGDDTTAYLHDGKETAIHDPFDNKGAKRKKKIATHEAAELTEEEAGDREDDSDDGESMTVRSPTGEGGADGGKQPIKRVHRTGLPDRTFGIERSRKGEDEDEEGVSKAEREAMEELAADENFSEVVEASSALEHLTNVFIKSIAGLRAEIGEVAKAQRKIQKSQKTTRVLLKGIATGDIEKALATVGKKTDKVEKSESERTIRKSGGPSRTADPGILAIVDGKPMRVKVDGSSMNLNKSEGYTAEFTEKLREGLVKGMNEGWIDPDMLPHLDSGGPGLIVKSLDPSQIQRLAKAGVELPS